MVICHSFVIGSWSLVIFAGGCRIPDSHGAVVAGGGKTPPARAECHAPCLFAVATKREDVLAGLGIPDLRRPVVADGGNPSSIGAVCQAIQGGGADGHRTYFLARFDIPQNQRVVI